MITTDVIIIGGGATGAGILRDLSMRGIPAILLEQKGFAYGTSSRFHGLLHSGGRYAVNDNDSAKECIEENIILKKIAKESIEFTEGFFALTPQDDPAYITTWLEGCKKAGIPVSEIDVKEAFSLEPNLSSGIKRVFRVPDSSIDGFRLVWQNVSSAKRYGGKVRTYCKVTAIHTEGGKVKGVTGMDTITGEKQEFACGHVINATGSWAGEIAAMAGLDVPVSPDRGALIVFNHRFTSRVINRLHKSADGDIFVPHGSVTILGTTSFPAKYPDDNRPSSQEIIRLLGIGETLFPQINDYRILRAFAGTRPLFSRNGEGRAASRNFAIVDHEIEGLEGLASIFGGKLTTFRLMAERTSDLVASKMGVTAKCRTATEQIVPEIPKSVMAKAKGYFPPKAVSIVADRVGPDIEYIMNNIGKVKSKNELVCECEMVTMAEIKYVAGDDSTRNLGDIRLRTRLGMGTCQGTFCSIRAIAALAEESINMPITPAENVKSFLQERWNGLRPVLWGSQMEEIGLTRAIYLSTLNLNGGYNEA